MMKKLLRTLFLVLPVVLISYAASGELTVEPLKETVSWTFKNDGQPVMVYAFNPQSFKPYVKELYSTTGKNVVRDSPSDHLHHHALMYGIKVNGVNFWEETPGCGIQKVVETAAPETSTVNNVPRATLRQTIHWVTPEDAFLPNTNAPVLLIEQRTITVGVDSKQEEVMVEWRSRFEVGTKTNTVVLTGANYHGLGMRFPQSFDPVAAHFTPEGSPDLSGSKQDVSAHRWTAIFFDSPSAPITLALFGDPRNARGQANYFSMKTPFAYLSATQGLEKEALVYQKGDHFELGYLVCVYPQKKTATSLNERAEKWISVPAK
jgi:hypothetical protein